MKRTIISLVLYHCLLGGLAIFSGCSNANSGTETLRQDGTQATQNIYAMNTYMTVTAYGAQSNTAVQESIRRIQELDALLSIGNPESEIGVLNQKSESAAATETVSDDTLFLVERALEVSRLTNGSFNPAMYPLMVAWGFPSQSYRVPSEAELQALLPRTDISRIAVDTTAKTVTVQQGTQLDLGGIAKGYTSSELMNIFDQYGITSGIVNLGGNVHVKGNKPDGSPWKIGIQDPKDKGEYLGILELSDAALITSGGYERNFTQDGVTYHHILDPKTGYPANHGLLSVSIVSKDATLADALSTALYVMGTENAIEFWRAHSSEFDCILMKDDGTILVTEGLQNQFTSDRYTWSVVTL